MVLTFALSVLATTPIAELIATSASHVVTTLVLLNKELATSASLSTGLLGPLLELLILAQTFIIDTVGHSLNLSALFLRCVLSARLINVVDAVTVEAVGHSARGAVVSALAVALSEEQIVALAVGALHHVRVLVTDAFPLEACAPLQLVLWEYITEVRERDLLVALGAVNGQVCIVDAGSGPLQDAWLVIHVFASQDESI